MPNKGCIFNLLHVTVSSKPNLKKYKISSLLSMYNMYILETVLFIKLNLNLLPWYNFNLTLCE